MERMVSRGVTHFKCATTLELQTACDAGARDVLLAYPVVGANGRRLRQLAHKLQARLSALVEGQDQLEQWKGSNVGLFIDINPGMDRTGIEQERGDEVLRLVRAIQDAGIEFRGLHYYDGHLGKFELGEREQVAHRGYDRLMAIVSLLERSGVKVEEVITAGTPALPCSLSFAAFAGADFLHRVSPGTVVYSDCTSLAQLPHEYGYRPAAVVLSTVVSHPTSSRFTCDAGHKTVSADAGVPTCAVLGRPELTLEKPSEEHLPVEVPAESTMPPIGDTLYLIPRHICPTVNNFDHALIVKGGRFTGVEPVTARGREAPFLPE
jgi:D-serine deaminase-like pyridoxal phosphate-dependent protein